jgi:DNA primase
MLHTGMRQFDAATLEGKTAIVAFVLPVLAALDNRVALESFLKKMADQLQVDESAIRSEFNKYVSHHPEVGQAQVVVSPSVAKQNDTARGNAVMAVAEENILRFLLEKPAACARICEKIDTAFFVDSRRRHIYQIISDTYAKQGMYTKVDIQEKLTPEEAEELARIMVLQDVPMDETVLMDYVKRFHLGELQKQYNEHSRKAAEYSRIGDERLIDELKICKDITEEIKKWS